MTEICPDCPTTEELSHVWMFSPSGEYILTTHIAWEDYIAKMDSDGYVDEKAFFGIGQRRRVRFMKG